MRHIYFRLLVGREGLISSEEGQATAEYALVIVAAAAVALALIVWASSTDVLSAFFDGVIGKVAGVVRKARVG